MFEITGEEMNVVLASARPARTGRDRSGKAAKQKQKWAAFERIARCPRSRLSTGSAGAGRQNAWNDF
jgi:hypothetical protein